MPSIEKPRRLKSGLWRLRIRFSDTKKTPSRTSVVLNMQSKTDLQTKAAEIVSLYHYGKFDPWQEEISIAPPEPQPHTDAPSSSPPRPETPAAVPRIADTLKAYIDYKTRYKWSPATAVSQRYQLNSFANTYGRHHPVTQITTETLTDWITYHHQTPETRRSYAIMLTSYTNWLHGEGYIPERIPRPRFPTDTRNTLPVYYTPEEITRIKKVIISENRRNIRSGVSTRRNSLWLLRLIDIALYTGLRLGELMDIRLRDIDLKQGTLIIGTRRPAKNREIRTLPIGQIHPLIRIIKAQLRDIRRTCPPATITPDTHFFLRTDPARASRTFTKYARIALPWRKNKFHALRHSCGTLLATHGLSIDQIAAWLGHRDTRSTQNYAKIHLATLGHEIGKTFTKATQTTPKKPQPKTPPPQPQ